MSLESYTREELIVLLKQAQQTTRSLQTQVASLQEKIARLQQDPSSGAVRAAPSFIQSNRRRGRWKRLLALACLLLPLLTLAGKHYLNATTSLALPQPRQEPLPIAGKRYLNATAESQYRYCRMEMAAIANAVQATRVNRNARDYSTWVGSRVADLISDNRLPDLWAYSTCPDGSYFTIVVGRSGDAHTFKVKCCPQYGAYEPGVDSD